MRLRRGRGRRDGRGRHALRQEQRPQGAASASPSSSSRRRPTRPRPTLRCTHIEIPQVAETYRVMGHSPWWVWGFEHGVNEHGVAIGNQSVFSNEPIEERPGLIGMDLVRLGLERGRSGARGARGDRDADRDATGRAARRSRPSGAGYHNSFLLADPSEAWLLETSNRRWAARRVARSTPLSNHFSIGDGLGDRFARSSSPSRGGRAGGAARPRRRGRRLPQPPRAAADLRGAPAALAASCWSGAAATTSRRFAAHPARPRGRRRRSGAGRLTPEEERYFTLCAHSEPVPLDDGEPVAALPGERRARGRSGSPSGRPARGSSCPSTSTA